MAKGATATTAAASRNDDPRRVAAFKAYQRPKRAEDPPPDFLLLLATLGSMVGVVMKIRPVSWLCLVLALSGAARARYGATGPAAVDAKQVAVALLAPVGGLATSYIAPSPEAIAKARAAREEAAAAAAAAAKTKQEAEAAAAAAVQSGGGDGSGGDDGWPATEQGMM
jgi:parvulin-like peptidyl-prolyl isomerase